MPKMLGMAYAAHPVTLEDTMFVRTPLPLEEDSLGILEDPLGLTLEDPPGQTLEETLEDPPGQTLEEILEDPPGQTLEETQEDRLGQTPEETQEDRLGQTLVETPEQAHLLQPSLPTTKQSLCSKLTSATTKTCSTSSRRLSRRKATRSMPSKCRLMHSMGNSAPMSKSLDFVKVA